MVRLKCGQKHFENFEGHALKRPGNRQPFRGEGRPVDGLPSKTIVILFIF